MKKNGELDTESVIEIKNNIAQKLINKKNSKIKYNNYE